MCFKVILAETIILQIEYCGDNFINSEFPNVALQTQVTWITLPSFSIRSKAERNITVCKRKIPLILKCKKKKKRRTSRKQNLSLQSKEQSHIAQKGNRPTVTQNTLNDENTRLLFVDMCRFKADLARLMQAHFCARPCNNDVGTRRKEMNNHTGTQPVKQQLMNLFLCLVLSLRWFWNKYGFWFL